MWQRVDLIENNVTNVGDVGDVIGPEDNDVL